jgi:heparosan-N-sulfate-glucuronate 5-epimerase
MVATSRWTPYDTFPTALSPRLRPDAVEGYLIDLRAKAPVPPTPHVDHARALYVPLIQSGLAAHERFIAGEGDAWLDGATRVGRVLLEEQETAGVRAGGWLHAKPCSHTYNTGAPWLSAMAQGQGASLFVRLAQAHGDEAFRSGALRALQPLDVPVAAGGTRSSLGDGWLPEEYPTEPPSQVLNGAIFALWGLHDVAVGLDDEPAARRFREGVDSLAVNIGRWDTGWWSRYDLFPHRLVNLASPPYHHLHISQLEGLNRVAPRRELQRMAERFTRYARSRPARTRALVHKVAFRSVVPRRRPARLAHPAP